MMAGWRLPTVPKARQGRPDHEAGRQSRVRGGNMQDRQDKRIFLWAIDPEDKIIRVNEDWLAFARENEAPHLTPDAVINRPLWDFVSGGETIHFIN